MEKLLPQNIDAELGVLGSLIIDPDAIAYIADTLQARDFYREIHQTLYEAILYLYNRQEPPDLITLCDYLEKRNKLDEVGGLAYITSLVSEVPTSGNVEHYAAIVRSHAINRRLIHAAGRIAALAYESSENSLEQAEQLIYQVSEGMAVTDLVGGTSVMSQFLNKLDTINREKGKLVGVPTGFNDLDFLLGGMQPQELYILGGRPGTGKSSFMLNILYHLLYKHDSRIAVFSLEMSQDDIARRLVSMDTGIDSQQLRTRLLRDEEWQKVVDSTDTLSTDQWFVDESGDLSITAIRSKARRHKVRHGLDVIIVDYLQLMHAETGDKKQENRVVEIGKISRGLKQLAKELDVPVLALASLSRAVESRADKRPMLSDLRESGSIESDADVVMFLSVHPSIVNHSIVDIAKHRHGPVGSVELYFEPGLTKFYSLADEPAQEEIA